MIYEVWSRYPSQQQECIGVVYSSRDAEQLHDRAVQRGHDAVATLVFIPGTNVPSYRITQSGITVC